MRKLKLQMQISLDGFNSAGPNDEQKWVTWAFDEIKQDIHELANSCDTEIIGRKLAVDYIPFWSDTLSQPNSELYDTSKIKAKQKKVVFTKTLEESTWENTVLAKGDLKEEVNKLKSQSGKDIIVYGGSSFVANLVKEGLIDEFYLFINPVALGQGTAIFEQLNGWQQLKLVNSKSYNCGIILLTYSKA